MVVKIREEQLDDISELKSLETDVQAILEALDGYYVPDLDGYATPEDLESINNDIQTIFETLDAYQGLDLDGYATPEDLENINNNIEVIFEALDGYQTPNLDGYATSAELEQTNIIVNDILDSLDGYSGGNGGGGDGYIDEADFLKSENVTIVTSSNITVTDQVTFIYFDNPEISLTITLPEDFSSRTICYIWAKEGVGDFIVNRYDDTYFGTYSGNQVMYITRQDNDWNVNSGLDQSYWIRALNFNAVQNSFKSQTEGSVKLNYRRLNQVLPPVPTYSHGVPTVGWSKSQYLRAEDVLVFSEGSATSVDLESKKWQAVVQINSDDFVFFNLPSEPEIGDIVDVYVESGAESILVNGLYTFSGKSIHRITCVAIDSVQWEEEEIDENTWIQAINKNAIKSSGILKINNNEALINTSGDGYTATGGKIVDAMCRIQSSDEKLKLDQVSSSSQATGSINNAENSNINGPTDVANGEFIRITWSVLLTISGVDHIADYVAVYKKASESLTIMQERAVFTPPTGVTITANVSDSDQPRLNIANAAGSSLTYFVHYSAYRQVK